MTLGFVIGWGNLNGVVSSNIYQKKDAPLYRPGHGVVFAYLLLALTGGSSLMTMLLRKENAKRIAGGRDYLVEGKDENEIEAMGDIRCVCLVLLQSDLASKLTFSQTWVFVHHLGYFGILSLVFCMNSSNQDSLDQNWISYTHSLGGLSFAK